MGANAHRPDPMLRLYILLVLTVVASTAPAVVYFWQKDGPTLWPLIGSIVAHLLVGTFGYHVLERRPHGAWPYLAIQTTLTLAILYFARGYGTVHITVIPLAAQAGILLGLRAALLYAVALVLLKPIPMLMLGGLRTSGHLFNFMFSSGTGIFFGVMFAQVIRRAWHDRAEVDRLNQSLTEANAQLEQAHRQTAALATAEERNRIAREIHDSVGHALTTLHVQLDAAGQWLERDPTKSRELLDKARSVAAQGLADVRRSVAAMRSDPVPAPLGEAIEALIEQANHTGAEVAFESTGTARPLDPDQKRALYRAAQEALTNARKHGARGRSSVILHWLPASARLEVRNPIAGTQDRNAASGTGLLGLRERAEQVGGSLTSVATDGEFRLCVEVPTP